MSLILTNDYINLRFCWELSQEKKHIHLFTKINGLKFMLQNQTHPEKCYLAIEKARIQP